MKQLASIILISSLAFNASANTSLYLGAGGSWNTLDESFKSTLRTSFGNGGSDTYDATHNRLAPAVQFGFWQNVCDQWLWGAGVKWKYLGYNTPNVNISRGQSLPNASFSSINIFGPEVLRDLSSITRMTNQVNLLLYFGVPLNHSYVYAGLGATMLTGSNSIYVSSVHHTNTSGDRLNSNSLTSYETLWGGVAEVGYSYLLNPDWSINLSYDYAQTPKSTFSNTVNAALYNGAPTPGATSLNLKRRISFTTQSFTLSVNKLFQFC